MESSVASEELRASLLSLLPYSLVATFFFTCLNLSIRYWKIGHIWLSKNTEKQQWVWRNILCSFVNANIAAVATVYCLYETPKLFIDPIDPYSLAGMRLTAYCIGYVIYDLTDMVVHEGKNDLLMHLHHTVSLTVFSLVILTGKYLALSIEPLLVEVNSIFLHARRLLILTGRTQGRLFAVVKWANLFTLVFIRIVSAAACSILCIINFHRFSWPGIIASALGIYMINSHNLHLLLSFYRSDVLDNRGKRD